MTVGVLMVEFGDVLVTVPDRFKYRDLVWDFCPSPK